MTGSHDGYDGFLARIVDVLAIKIRKTADRLVTGFIDFDFRPTIRRVDAADHEPTILAAASSERR